MAKIKLNTNYKIKLSLKSLEEYKNFLKEYKEQLPKIAENIVKKTSELGLENNYKSTKMKSIQNTGRKVIGGIQTTDEKDTYKEFGTGIVGNNNPHLSEYLAQVGWNYDVNEHGEKGWIYPKGDGTYGWTKGLPAEKKFYEAIKNMEDNLKIIAIEEFNNFNGS